MPQSIMSIQDWSKLPAGRPERIGIALGWVYKAQSIHDLFDSLCSLIKLCQLHLNDKFKLDINKLEQQAKIFAMAIVDARDSNDLNIKMALREKYKKVYNQYMPWHLPATAFDPTKIAIDQKGFTKKTTKFAIHSVIQVKIKRNIKNKRYNLFNEAYAHEGDSKFLNPFANVVYLKGNEKEAYRIFPYCGQFMQIKRSGDNLSLLPFDTENYSVIDGPKKEIDRALFVISVQGDFYAGNGIAGEFHHSSFLGREPLFFAGSMCVTQGVVRELDDESGHFTPGIRQNIQALAFLRNMGCLEQGVEYKTLSKLGDEKVQAILNERGVSDNAKSTITLRTFNFNSLKQNFVTNLDKFISNHGQLDEKGNYQIVLSSRLYHYDFLKQVLIETDKFKKALAVCNDSVVLRELLNTYMTNVNSLGAKIFRKPPDLQDCIESLKNAFMDFQIFEIKDQVFQNILQEFKLKFNVSIFCDKNNDIHIPVLIKVKDKDGNIKKQSYPWKLIEWFIGNGFKTENNNYIVPKNKWIELQAVLTMLRSEEKTSSGLQPPKP